MHRLSYLAYQYIDGHCSLHIPNHIVALEFTSCSFNSPSCFVHRDSVLSNIKFLQICNCRFSNQSFQKLLSLCPNVVHLSVTTSSWDNAVTLPSSLLSIIWKHNDGDFMLLHCKQLWEVSLTIYDSEMIRQLEPITSLRQLVIATPLFKEMNFLKEMDKPWLFTSHQNTPTLSCRSPSIRSISQSPKVPGLNHRLHANSPSIRSLNRGSNLNGCDLELLSLCNAQRSLSNQSLSSRMSTVSLDSDDDDEDAESVCDGTLRIVCFEELIDKEWFTKHFVGDHIIFDGDKVINPVMQSEFNKLNPIFVREMQHTTHMFLQSFPFF